MALLIQMFTGCRHSETKRRGAAGFDLSAGTFIIEDDPGAGKRAKNPDSVPVIPIPQLLCDDRKGYDFEWLSVDWINKRLKAMNPELWSHSFRHEWWLHRRCTEFQFAEVSFH